MTKKNEQPEKLEKELEVWKGKYLRALADYQNLEKRSQERNLETRKYAESQLVVSLLPVVDMLEQAEIHIGDEGLKIALKELQNVLQKIGVEKIDVEGKKFDPSVMECVEVTSPGNDEVIEVTRAGYCMQGRLLRPAQVKVGKKDTTADQKLHLS